MIPSFREIIPEITLNGLAVISGRGFFPGVTRNDAPKK
jgi:hypothetical protein